MMPITSRLLYGTFAVLFFASASAHAREASDQSSAFSTVQPHECIDLAARGQTLARELLGLGDIRVDLDVDVLCEQITQTHSVVAFLDALTLAAVSFRSDGSDSESPLGLARSLARDEAAEAGVNVESPAVELRAHEILASHLNNALSSVRLLPLNQQAPHGEATPEAWIFEMSLPTLGDHGFYAVVSRDGLTDVYNYGFN
jgi:hypothetical protein